MDAAARPAEALAAPPPSPRAAAASVGGMAGKQMALRADGNAAEGKLKDAEERGTAAPPAALPRANFAETAFWQPQLLTGPDGSATISFTVPDSVTSWSLWVHAISKTLLSGSASKQVQSVKELMVRPNVPRFLREGDRADLTVVVNNAADRELSGELRFALADPDTGHDLASDFGLTPADLVRPFKVAKGGSTNVAFALAAPRRVGMATLKVTAVAGNLSDGELRPLPLLPSRVHLTQSRFVTLTNKETREMKFPEMAAADPTRVNDQMVVTVDAQLFQTVLQALPYLVRYPYECTEQTLNRFLSTGIVSSVFKDHPAIANLAKTFSARETPLATFDAADPNRKLALEESPWLNEAQGGKEPGTDYINVLDPKIAAAERASALAKLEKAQTSLGGFPWFPGGPPDPYMTVYIMSGFARATEFNVPVPKQMVTRGWQYLARHFREDYLRHMRKDNCCWEWLTFLNYVASSYPDASWTGNALTDAERKEILAFSFRHWKQHSPYLKGLLALTLSRAGRGKDARLVWDSVMDSAKTRKDEGTFWAPEDRSWLWYNDTIETHAFALRTLMELDPREREEGWPRPLAAPQQEAESVEEHARDGRGDLRAGPLPQEGRRPGDPRARGGDGGGQDDRDGVRARRLQRQAAGGDPRPRGRQADGDGDGGEGDEGLRVRERELELLDGAAPGRRARRLLQRLAPLLQARDRRPRGDADAAQAGRDPGGGRRAGGADRPAHQARRRVRPPARPARRRLRARARRLRLPVRPRHLLVRRDPRLGRQLLLRASSPPASTPSSTACAPACPAPSASAPRRCSRCTRPSSTRTRPERR